MITVENSDNAVFLIFFLRILTFSLIFPLSGLSPEFHKNITILSLKLELKHLPLILFHRYCKFNLYCTVDNVDILMYFFSCTFADCFQGGSTIIQDKRDCHPLRGGKSCDRRSNPPFG